MRSVRLLLLLAILAGPLAVIGVLTAPVVSDVLASLPAWPGAASTEPEQGLPGQWRIDEVTVNVKLAPKPCADTPTAKPRARQSLILSRLSTGVAVIAPITPDISTITAARAGMPPN